MNFGEVIAGLKDGKRYTRSGWNGKGMYIFLTKGDEECNELPHIDMYTVDSHGRRAILRGWLASQTDMLSDDWVEQI